MVMWLWLAIGKCHGVRIGKCHAWRSPWQIMFEQSLAILTELVLLCYEWAAKLRTER